MLKEDYPWVYDIGIDLIDKLKSKKTSKQKHQSIMEFRELLEFSFEHPFMREMIHNHPEERMMFRELPHFLMRAFEENQSFQE